MTANTPTKGKHTLALEAAIVAAKEEIKAWIRRKLEADASSKFLDLLEEEQEILRCNWPADEGGQSFTPFIREILIRPDGGIDVHVVHDDGYEDPSTTVDPIENSVNPDTICKFADYVSNK